MVITADLPMMVPGGSTGASCGADEALERASQLIAVLRGLVPCSAIVLSAWDPTANTHRHRALASDGYPPEVIDHLNDGFVKENPAFHLLHTAVPRALRWRDLRRDWNLDFARTYSAEAVLIPAGFNEGTTACLRLPGGRYTGSLHANWSSPAAATDAARDIIERFRPLLADACDLLRGPQILADALVPDAFALLVSTDRVATELPGRPPGPHLADGGTLRRFLTRRWPDLRNRRFLWIDDADGWHRVELIPCRGGATLVAERSVTAPHGLTPRELEVLHLLSTGASNPEIAERLYVSRRTVATHVEHILAKLRCGSRAQLAAMAAAEGLLLAETPRVEPTFAGPRPI